MVPLPRSIDVSYALSVDVIVPLTGVDVEYRSTGIDVMCHLALISSSCSLRHEVSVPFRRMYERAWRFLACHMNDVTDTGTLTLFTTKVRCACCLPVTLPPSSSSSLSTLQYARVCLGALRYPFWPVGSSQGTSRGDRTSRQHHIRARLRTPAGTPAGTLGPAAVVS